MRAPLLSSIAETLVGCGVRALTRFAEIKLPVLKSWAGMRSTGDRLVGRGDLPAHQSQLKEKAQRFYHYRSAFRFLLLPGEGQDEGSKMQNTSIFHPLTLALSRREREF